MACKRSGVRLSYAPPFSQRRDDGWKRYLVQGISPKAIVCINLHINQLPIGTIIWVNVNEYALGAQTIGFPWNCLKITRASYLLG